MDFKELHGRHIEVLSRGVGAALDKTGFAALVVHSGTPQKRTDADDQYWPLRPTPHFQHWLPLAEPGCLLIAVPGLRPVLMRPPVQSFWEAPPAPESDHFWGSFEVVETVPPLPAGRVACVAEANRRAAPGHEELRRLFRGADRSELELHLAFLGTTRQDDAETPYKNIVALGKHAATLHHVSYQKRAQPALSLLVDAGASFAGYCSDITRTWVKGGGAAASAFSELVAGMEAMQQRLCSQVRVGMPYEELHDESHRQVAGILRQVGISRLPADELVSRGITRAFYPHGLGHALGLQCHDVGCGLRAPRADNPFLRNTTDVAPEQVFTIEPGLYFIDALLAPFRPSPDIDWKLVDALSPFGGIRIEDDVVVHDSGIRNLTREVLPDGGGVV